MNRPERLPSRYKPYVWAVGEGIETIPAEDLVHKRYRVIAPHIWLDTQPEQRPETPDRFPAIALPYLQAHPHRLHVPGLYAVLEQPGDPPVLLLENAPIHPQSGALLPSLAEAWPTARPVRQMQWLWQLWELWQQLSDLGVATSLIDLDNIRVEGWRVRLRELWLDAPPLPLASLAETWQPLLATARPVVASPLSTVLDAMTADDREAVNQQLNQSLLAEAAIQYSVRISLAGATHPGVGLPRNEDACYPDGAKVLQAEELEPCLGIVCDGVGGHQGGEVASRIALQSLQLQLRGLLAEAIESAQVVPPSVVKDQISAAIRIVNDLINRQNNDQERVDRQRMGTTLVMAVVVPQRVQTREGWQRVDELYIAHVGDSRAYWITPDYCHLLTVDDDIAGREAKAGRQTLPIAQERPDAQALTQAIGTRGMDYLHPHIQRFVVDETGVLLLCSDGLSDNNRIEEAWANYIGLIVKDIVSLEAAVASWIELANQKNGHDNTAVVLMYCKAISKQVEPTATASASQDSRQTEFTEASKALLYGEMPAEEPTPVAQTSPKRPLLPLWLWVIAGLLIAIGLVAGWRLFQISTPETAPETPAEIDPSANP